MELLNVLPIVAILAAAVVLVVVLRRYMRTRVRDEPGERRVDAARAAPHASPSPAEEQEYLDSSHIITGPGAGRRDPPR